MQTPEGYDDIPAERPQWDKVRCPKFHDLELRTHAPNSWICDASHQFHDVQRATKSRYGLEANAPWSCLSGDTDGASYRCAQCDFDLCELCYARADQALVQGRAIAKAMQTEKKVRWMQSKLMVVGEGRAGKTSTVRTLLGLGFSDAVESTIGAELTHVHTQQGGPWDSSKNEAVRDYALHAAVQEVKAHGQNKALAEKIKAKLGFPGLVTDGGGGRARTVAVPRGPDRGGLGTGEASASEVAEVMGEFKLELMNQSLAELTSVKFTIWDYGGQSVFYTLHHLFLTKYGIYLVVFNLHDFVLDPDDALRTIKFWMRSIKLHAPDAPVFLVATHADALRDHGDGKLELVNEELMRSLKRYAVQLQTNPASSFKFFPISNKSKRGVKAVRESIERSCQDLEFLHLEVSIRWLRVLDRVLKQAPEQPWMHLQKVREFAETLGVTTVGEVDAMLDLFHELGVLIHFGYTTALDNIVVANPQFLLREISKVIRDSSIHAYDVEDIERCGLTSDLQRMQEQALVSLDLLEYFWGQSTTRFFIDLMRHTLLMSDWAVGKHDEKLFLVPSLLDDSMAASEWPDGPRCKFRFSKGILPEGVFSRIVCLCLEVYRSAELDVSSEIGKSFVFLRSNKDKSFMHLSVEGREMILTSSTLDRAEHDAVCIESMLQKVNQDIMGSGLKWKQLFLDEATDAYVTKEAARKARLQPWFGRSTKRPGLKAQTERLDLDEFVKALA